MFTAETLNRWDLTYSFIINGYDVTVNIEFFLDIVVLENFSPKLTDVESENLDISLSL